MKRLLLYIFSILFALSFCILPAQAETERLPSLSEELSALPDDWLPKGTLLSIIGDGSTDEMHLYLWDLQDSLKLHNDGRAMYRINSSPHSLHAVNRRAPITNLYKLSDDIVYTVYTMCGDDNNLYCVYAFFESLDPTINGTAPDTEYWWMTDRVFFVHDILSYQDFSDVAPGSTAAFVTAIDPAAGLQLISADEMTGEIDEQTSCHYLTDGILYLTYRLNEAKTEFVVTDMRFDPTFTLIGFQGTMHNTSCVLPQQQESVPGAINAEIQTLLSRHWDHGWWQPGAVFYAPSGAKELADAAAFTKIQVGSTTASQARSILGAPHLFVGGKDWKEAYYTADGHLMVLDYGARENAVLKEFLVYHPQWNGGRSWSELYSQNQPFSQPQQPPYYIYITVAVVVLSAALCGVAIWRRQHKSR